MHTFYDILEVSKEASPETITAAYRSLCKRYHPDINKSSPIDTERLKKIIEAYETLNDGSKRRRYDERFRSSGTKEDTQTQPPANHQQTGEEVQVNGRVVTKLVLCGLASLFNGLGLATEGVGNWYWDGLFVGMLLGLVWSSMLLFALPPMIRFLWRFGIARLADVSRSVRGKD